MLAALADPMRRDVLAAVAARSGTATATDLAAELPVTRQAIAKHLGVLADAGLVTSVRQGREARYRVVAGSLRPASDWIQRTEASWSRRVDRLQQHLADRATARLPPSPYALAIRNAMSERPDYRAVRSSLGQGKRLASQSATWAIASGRWPSR